MSEDPEGKNWSDVVAMLHSLQKTIDRHIHYSIVNLVKLGEHEFNFGEITQLASAFTL